MASLPLRGGEMKFENDDAYNTPKEVWESISHLIPKDKTIWECFYGDGKSGQHFKELGFECIHDKIDFFNDPNFEYDILISNPPYSIKAKVFKRLSEIDKPFIMLVPVSTMTKQYLKTYFKDNIQIIIPKKRIQFIKNGEQTSRCWFDTIFITYKMNLDKDIIFL